MTGGCLGMVRLFVAQKFVAQKKEERLNPEWIQPWVLKVRF
jgi:hypothetical protein